MIPGDRTEEERAIMLKVVGFALTKEVEKEHAQQVASLSLILFDMLSSLHNMGREERILLESAAILHDVGKIKGGKSHHKWSRDIILQSESLPFDETSRKIVAMLARYHRRSLPDETHEDYMQLDEVSRAKVDKLSAILRVADGLDKSHTNIVKGLVCSILDDKVVVRIVAESFSDLDKISSQAKSELFEKVFRRKFAIEWLP